MGLTAVFGLPGKGKSLWMLHYSLSLAEKYKLPVLYNYILNPDFLSYYCRVHNLKWVCDNLSNGIISFISSDANLNNLLTIPRTIIVLDEAGIYLSSREVYKTPKALIKGLVYSRKNTQYLIYAAQDPGMVDPLFNNLVEEVYYCDCVSVFDKTLNNQKVVFKKILLFDAMSFQKWFNNSKLRSSIIKTLFVLTTKRYLGVLSVSDRLAFFCYDSFAEMGAFELLSATDDQALEILSNTVEEKTLQIQNAIEKQEHFLVYIPAMVSPNRDVVDIPSFKFAPEEPPTQQVNQNTQQSDLILDDIPFNIFTKKSARSPTVKKVGRNDYKKDKKKESITEIELNPYIIWTIRGNNMMFPTQLNSLPCLLAKILPGDQLKFINNLDNFVNYNTYGNKLGFLYVKKMYKNGSVAYIKATNRTHPTIPKGSIFISVYNIIFLAVVIPTLPLLGLFSLILGLIIITAVFLLLQPEKPKKKIAPFIPIVKY